MSAAEAMELVNEWNSLDPGVMYGDSDIIVPRIQLREIQQRCSTTKETAKECASYYICYHPQPSWTHLAECLYKQGEFAAVEKLKPFLPLRGKYMYIVYTNVMMMAISLLCVHAQGVKQLFL